MELTYEQLIWGAIGLVALTLAVVGIIAAIVRHRQKENRWEEERRHTLNDLDAIVLGSRYYGSWRRTDKKLREASPNSLAGRLARIEQELGIEPLKDDDPF